jgi:hypothetical protein
VLKKQVFFCLISKNFRMMLFIDLVLILTNSF